MVKKKKKEDIIYYSVDNPPSFIPGQQFKVFMKIFLSFQSLRSPMSSILKQLIMYDDCHLTFILSSKYLL